MSWAQSLAAAESGVLALSAAALDTNLAVGPGSRAGLFEVLEEVWS